VAQDDFFSFDVSAPSSSATENQSGSQIDTSDTASGAILSSRRANRGRSKGSRNKSGVGEGASVPLTAEEQQALEQMFKPEIWRGIVRAPADAALFLTGSKAWELQDKETDQLAIGASTTARYFMPSHPKWIALSLFAFSLLTVYGSHFVAYRLEQKNRNVGPKRSDAGVVSPLRPADGSSIQ